MNPNSDDQIDEIGTYGTTLRKERDCRISKLLTLVFKRHLRHHNLKKNSNTMTIATRSNVLKKIPLIFLNANKQLRGVLLPPLHQEVQVTVVHMQQYK